MADGNITISPDLKTEEVKKQAQNLKKICEDLLDAIDKEAEKTSGKVSAGVRTVQRYLQDLVKEVESAQKNLEEIQKGPDSGDKAEKIEEQTKALEGLNNEMREYQEHLKEVAQAEIEREEAAGNIELPSAEAVNVAIKKLTKTTEEGFSGMSDGMSAFVANFNSGFVRETLQGTGTIGRAFSNMFASMTKIFKAHPLIGIAIAAISFALKKLITTIKETVKEVDAFLKLVSKGLTKALKNSTEIIVGLTRAYLSLGNTVAGTVVTGFKLLLNKLLSLKSTVMEYLNYMAQWNNGNNALNKSLSNLYSSLNYIKGALASAFAPIVTYIEPMLTSLMDKIAELITLFGMMIAKLTGATSFQKVIRKQKDYAKSLDETNEKLAEYDKLQVIDQNKGEGGVGWENVGLEDIPIPDWLKNLQELGKNLGTWFRDFLNGIPWNSVQTGAYKAAQAISDFINGLLSVDGLGTSIGHTLAQLGNTFLTFINTLLTQIHFDQLGKQLGEAFTALLKEFHFDELGDMFANALNDLADLIAGFFRNFSGTDLGEALSEFLQHGLGNINWAKINEALDLMVEDLVQFLNSFLTPENFALIGQTIANVFNTIFQTIGDFARQGDWKGWGESISNGIIEFFKNFDAKENAQAISNFALGLLNMLDAAISNIFDGGENQQMVTDKIVEFFTNIDWAGIGSKAVEISQKLMEGLKQIWEKLKETDAFDDLIRMIVDFLKEKKNWETFFKQIKFEFIKDILIEKIKDGFSNLGQSILDRISESVSLVNIAGELFGNVKEDFENKDWIAIGADILGGIFAALLAPWDFILSPFTGLFDWIIQGIKDIFGINSPADTMLPVGENIVLGILDGFGLVDFVGKIQEWWNTNVAPWFTFQRWAELGDNMKRAMSEKVDGMKTSLVTKFTSLKTNLSTIFDNIKTKFIDVWKNVKEGIKNPINNILSGIEVFINAVINGLNNMVGAINGLHFDVPDWVPLIGGKSLGFTIPQLSNVTLPRLAQGAVIPPNKQFAAILGDQKSGMNIETPLDTMIQAFKQALAETGGTHDPVILQLNGRTVAQAVWDEEKKRYKQTGMAY